MRKIITLAILTLLCLSNIKAQKTFVFIGSYNFDKSKEGIYVYELDTLTGKLIKITSVSNVLNPGFLTLSENGIFLYATTDAKTPKAGSVSSYKFDANEKSLTYINTQQTGGENPVYLSLHKNGKWLLNANYQDGSVSVYPVNEYGNISPVAQFIRFTDSSINKKRQEGAHIHATVFSPDGNYIFLPDLGADKIRNYYFDSLQLQPLKESSYSFIKTKPGSGPRHFTFHPNGKYAYCVEELSGFLSVYNYKNGILDSIQRIATHPKKYKAEYSSADIHISPDGKFLYVSNRGEENNIAIFSIEKKGTLKPTGFQSTYGKTPRNFCIDNTGKFLIVANQSTGNIVVFKRNTKTGFLEKTAAEINIENPTCVLVKQYPK